AARAPDLDELGVIVLRGENPADAEVKRQIVGEVQIAGNEVTRDKVIRGTSRGRTQLGTLSADGLAAQMRHAGLRYQRPRSTPAAAPWRKDCASRSSATGPRSCTCTRTWASAPGGRSAASIGRRSPGWCRG